MRRTVIALFGLAMLAASGLAADPAAAYAEHQDQWHSGIGQREAASSARATRSATRSSRATRQRARVAAASEDFSETAPRSARRGRAARAPLPSITGGSSLGSGIASYYWQPQRVASGGWFNPNALTAAHRTLPFGTRVRVTNLSNGRSVTVRINDRGPFIRGRVIDLSRAAAAAVGMTGAGLARVSMAVVGRG